MARFTQIATVFILLFTQVLTLFADTTISPAAERAEPALKWRTRVIPIAISTSLLHPASNVKYGSDLVGAVRRSLRSWEEAGGIEFREVISDRQNASPQGVAGDGISLITVAPTAENALLFSKNAEDAAATTRVFFDARGRISEADIVLNPYQQFSTDGTFGTFDLESTITHEIGHVLGLEHSSVRGSTMYENFSKNGVFGLPGFALRTVSEIDRTELRAKYGLIDTRENCCGTISAKFQFPEGKPASNLDVWLEDSLTGKVAAQATTGQDGSAEFTGLNYAAYTIYSARRDRAKKPLPMQSLGSVSVSNEPVVFSKKLESGPDDLDVKYSGFNGQLTLNAVPINSGKSYTIYIGGRNLSPKTVSVRFGSPFFEVLPGSMTAHDYGDDLSVVSFEVTSAAQTPVGEYSIFVESTGGSRAAIVGGISVRSFSNPFGNIVFDTK